MTSLLDPGNASHIVKTGLPEVGFYTSHVSRLRDDIRVSQKNSTTYVEKKTTRFHHSGVPAAGIRV